MVPCGHAPMNRPRAEIVSGSGAGSLVPILHSPRYATHCDYLLPSRHIIRSRAAVRASGSRPARRSGRATRGSRGSPRRSNRRRPYRPPRPHRSRDAQPRGVLQRPTHSRCQRTIRRSAADHGRGAGRGRHVERKVTESRWIWAEYQRKWPPEERRPVDTSNDPPGSWRGDGDRFLKVADNSRVEAACDLIADREREKISPALRAIESQDPDRPTALYFQDFCA